MATYRPHAHSGAGGQGWQQGEQQPQHPSSQGWQQAPQGQPPPQQQQQQQQQGGWGGGSLPGGLDGAAALASNMMAQGGAGGAGGDAMMQFATGAFQQGVNSRFASAVPVAGGYWNDLKYYFEVLP